MGSRFRFGQVVWAWFRFESEGKYKSSTKLRAVIILDADDQIDEESILVVPTTDEIDYPLDKHPFQVFVHSTHAYDEKTGLRLPTVAKCNFADDIAGSRIEHRKDILDEDLLEKIVDAYDKYIDDVDG